MTLSEDLARLSVRAGEAEKRVAEARTEARERLEQDVEHARQRTQETADRVQQRTEQVKQEADAHAGVGGELGHRAAVHATDPLHAPDTSSVSRPGRKKDLLQAKAKRNRGLRCCYDFKFESMAKCF